MPSIPSFVSPGQAVKASDWNALIAYIRSTTVHPGSGVRVTTGASGVTYTAAPQRGGGGKGRVSYTPFLVYTAFDNTEPPYPVLKLYPGKIAGIVPKIGTASLDQKPLPAIPQPWLYTPGEPFDIYLKVVIDLIDPAIQYRSSVKSVAVKMSSEADVKTDIALQPADPVTGQKVLKDGTTFWTGTTEQQAAKEKGYFYLLVASVDATTDEDGNIVVKQITQWLFTSFVSFAISDSAAIPLV